MTKIDHFRRIGLGIGMAAFFTCSAPAVQSAETTEPIGTTEPTAAAEKSNSKTPDAQETPFQLRVEKTHVHEPQPPVSAGTRLNRSDTPPSLAPPTLTQRTGASMDKSQFLLNAEQLGAFTNQNQALTPLKASTAATTLKGATSIQALSGYDIELIVDQSMSMVNNMDCPGGLTRWRWCGKQAKDLARQLAPLVPRGFTLTTFNKEYQVYENASPGHVEQLFKNPGFRGGTKLSRPLEDRLDNYFRKRGPQSKPLLIAVITDGAPVPRKSEPYMVANTLINASHQIKDAREVTVVFFQIGSEDERGRWFLSEMDNNLVPSGASCDFVRTVSFEELQRIGLPRALANSIRDFSGGKKKALKD